MKAKKLIEGEFKLEKIPGKGGWNYGQLPGLEGDRSLPFNRRKVKGNIDGIVIRKSYLMPMGKGVLFLPVNAAIRKMIRKEAGAGVHVTLFDDKDPLEIPYELYVCLDSEPEAII